MVRSVRIATLVTLWLVPLLIFVSAFNSGWVKTWSAFGVPSMEPHFLDLYSVPTGIETLHKGGDPLVANPADPLRRPLNYPRIWLYLFSAARIDRGKVPALGVLFCAFYLACISWLILHTTHALDAAILLLAGLTVSPLLAIERGNSDLLIFSMVFLACVVTNKHCKSILFAVAALLKIFPLAGMAMDVIRRPRKERVFAAVLTGLVLAAILLQWRDLSLIRAATPVYSVKSFGVLSLEQEILIATFQRGFLIGLGWVVVLECWLAGAFTIACAWKNPWKFDGLVGNSNSSELFSVFGAMYVFTYAVGSSFDYRLIFLLPTLPLVLEMSRDTRYRVWAIVYIALVGLSENSLGFERSGGTVAGHAATFALFLILLAMLTSLVSGSNKVLAGYPEPLQRKLAAVHPSQSLHSID
jgi:hypothetical protein